MAYKGFFFGTSQYQVNFKGWRLVALKKIRDSLANYDIELFFHQRNLTSQTYVVLGRSIHIRDDGRDGTS